MVGNVKGKSKSMYIYYGTFTAFKGFLFIFAELPGLSLNLCIRLVSITSFDFEFEVLTDLGVGTITFIFSCVLYFNLMPPSSKITGVSGQLNPIQSLHVTHDFVDFYISVLNYLSFKMKNMIR